MKQRPLRPLLPPVPYYPVPYYLPSPITPSPITSRPLLPRPLLPHYSIIFRRSTYLRIRFK